MHGAYNNRENSQRNGGETIRAFTFNYLIILRHCSRTCDLRGKAIKSAQEDAISGVSDTFWLLEKNEIMCCVFDAPEEGFSGFIQISKSFTTAFIHLATDVRALFNIFYYIFFLGEIL